MIFFDTNIIVYGLDATAPEAKREFSLAMVHEAIANRTAVISWQVVQETLHVVAHRFRASISPDDQQSLLDNILLPLWQIQPSRALYVKSLLLQSRHGFAFHDCLIVAAALEAGAKRLMTDDLQHGQRIEGLRVENPFKS